MKTFDSFNLAAPIAENLKKLGFETPTPIQAEGIPVVLEGRDVVGIAQTGTGKTAAFVLPMLHKLMPGPRRQIRALIIGPTRELVEQINGVVHQLGRGTDLHCATIYGGVSYRPQFEAIRRGAEIVAACPGRLLDHMQQRSINLSKVEILVLDEADQMFDMGFLPAIKQIIKALPAHKQVLLFSATMPPEIRKLAHDILRNPAQIQIAASAPIETVSHAIYPVSQNMKADLLIALLRKTDTGPVLIFTRTRHRTKKLDDTLNRAGFRAISIQGDLSQKKRQSAMDGFRSGKFQILVATDVAARGIDVAGISHVINFDIPDKVDAYTHRIGRTGRAAKTGDAYTLVTREDADMVRQIEKVLRAPIERRFLEGFEYKDEKGGGHGQRPHRAPQGHGGRPQHQGGERSHRPQHGGSSDRFPDRPRHESSAHRPAQHGGRPQTGPSAPRREEAPRDVRHTRPHDEQPRPQPAPAHREQHRAPSRHDEAPRHASQQQPAERKPYYGAGLEDRSRGPQRKSSFHRKDDSAPAPTMTGAAPHQKSAKKEKTPFWQRYSNR